MGQPTVQAVRLAYVNPTNAAGSRATVSNEQPPIFPATSNPQEDTEEEGEETFNMVLQKQLKQLHFSRISQVRWRKRYKANLWAEVITDENSAVFLMSNGTRNRVEVKLEHPFEDIRQLNNMFGNSRKSFLKRHGRIIAKSSLLFAAGMAGVIIGFKLLLSMVS